MLELLHWIGTKPLIISLVSQVIVLGVALRKHDRTQIAESCVLAAGLTLLIVGIALRPPQPMQLGPDIVGAIAAVTFVVPAIKALSKLRSPGDQPAA